MYRFKNFKSYVRIALLCIALVIPLVFQSPKLIKLGLIERLFSNQEFSTLVLYSQPIRPIPNNQIEFRLYGPKASLKQTASIKLNSFGMFPPDHSSYKGKSGERTLVVIGGEQSASSVVTKSWPELLQTIFDSNLETKNRVRVVNCAWPDAGPMHYLEMYNGTKNLIEFPNCSKFKPDLVLVNMVETDFLRFSREGAVNLKYKGKPVDSSSNSAVTFSIDGFESTFRFIGTKKPKTIAEPNAIPVRPFAATVHESIIDNESMIYSYQQKITRMFAHGYKPSFKDFAESIFTWSLPPASNPKRYCVPFTQKCKTFFGVTLSDMRNFDSEAITKPEVSDDLVMRSIPTFQSIASMHKDVHFLLTFNYSQLTQGCFHPLSDKLRLKINLKFKSLCETAISSWNPNENFLIPFMSEKFSEIGMYNYSRLVYEYLESIQFI